MSTKASEQVTTQVTEETMCTRKEKLGHTIGVLGHDSAYSLYSSYITPFMTDILALPAAFIGVISVVARVLDAFTDISMGFIADRTKSKWGRYRPWILRAAPLFVLCMILSFVKLPIGMTGLCIFAGIMYFVTGSFAFTAVDIPYWSLPAAMTSNTKERSEIIGMTTTASGVISAMIGIIVPLMLKHWGQGDWHAYFYTALIIGAFALIMYLTCFRCVREHVVPDPQQKFSLKLGLKNIYTNKPLLLLQITNIIFLLAKIMRGYLNYYYCTYNLGNVAIMAVISAISTVTIFVGASLGTVLSKKLGKKTLLFMMMGLYAIACVVQYFAGWTNLYIIYVCGAVMCIAIGAANVCTNSMLADTIEYGEWKTGQRNEGLINSTRCFVVKCVMGVSGAIIAALIGITGFVPMAEVQTAGVLNSFHFMSTLFGGGLMILAVVPMFFYDLTEKRHAEIMEELKARKAGK